VDGKSKTASHRSLIALFSTIVTARHFADFPLCAVMETSWRAFNRFTAFIIIIIMLTFIKFWKKLCLCDYSCEKVIFLPQQPPAGAVSIPTYFHSASTLIALYTLPKSE
jgi:hypothetical protein